MRYHRIANIAILYKEMTHHKHQLRDQLCHFLVAIVMLRKSGKGSTHNLALVKRG